MYSHASTYHALYIYVNTSTHLEKIPTTLSCLLLLINANKSTDHRRDVRAILSLFYAVGVLQFHIVLQTQYDEVLWYLVQMVLCEKSRAKHRILTVSLVLQKKQNSPVYSYSYISSRSRYVV